MALRHFFTAQSPPLVYQEVFLPLTLPLRFRLCFRT